MKTLSLENQEDYLKVMEYIEKLLQKSTNMGGFAKLSFEESEELSDLSILAEEFEDRVPLMPIW